jgi:hypothetical protein
MVIPRSAVAAGLRRGVGVAALPLGEYSGYKLYATYEPHTGDEDADRNAG